MSSKIDYPTWVASHLPDVTYAPDARGKWRYWEVLQVGEEKRDGDVVGKLQYRRPHSRPTERLLEACRVEVTEEDGRTWTGYRVSTDTEPLRLLTAEEFAAYLTACEHSCQAEPGDGKPVPQEVGEEGIACPKCHQGNLGTDCTGEAIECHYCDEHGLITAEIACKWRDVMDEQAGDLMAADIRRDEDTATIASLQQQVRSESAKGSKEAWDLIESRIRASAAHLGIEIGDSSCPIYHRVTQVFDRLQQQVAGLTDRAEHFETACGIANGQVDDLVARATAAEAERDSLRKQCEAAKEWITVFMEKAGCGSEHEDDQEAEADAHDRPSGDVCQQVFRASLRNSVRSSGCDRGMEEPNG